MGSFKTLLAAAIAAQAIAVPASAVTFTVVSLPHSAGAPSGHVAMCGVSDPACRNRWTGAYAITTHSVHNRHLIPAGWTGEYAAVPGPTTIGGSAMLSFAGIGPIHSWSLLWGSAGRSNLLELFHTGSISPYVVNMNDVISTNMADPLTTRINRWVTITGDVPFTMTGARFSHPNFAFESTAFGIRPKTTTFTGPVPEPATWAMMIIGFGLTGMGLRHRRPAPAVAG